MSSTSHFRLINSGRVRGRQFAVGVGGAFSCMNIQPGFLMTPLFRKFQRRVGIGAMHYLVNIGCNCQQNRTCTIPCDPEDVHMIAGALNEIRPQDLTDALLEYGLIVQSGQNKLDGTARVKFFEDMNKGIVCKFGNKNAEKAVATSPSNSLVEEKEEVDAESPF